MNSEADPDVILDKAIMPTLSKIDKRGLRFAPAEIRIIIFENCFPEKVSVVKRAFPPLFKALRHDKQLYEEAFEVYSKDTTFKVDWEDWCPKQVPLELDEMEAIRKLVISFDYRGHDVSHMGDRIEELQLSYLVHEILYGCNNVTELTLYFPHQIYDDWIETDDSVFTKISLCGQSFPELRKFTLKFERSRYWVQHQLTLETYGKPPQPGDVAFGEPFYPRIIEAVDDVLGFRGDYHHNFAEMEKEEEEDFDQSGDSNENTTVDSDDDEEEEERETARMISTWDAGKYCGPRTLLWRMNRLRTWLYDVVYRQSLGGQGSQWIVRNL